MGFKKTKRKGFNFFRSYYDVFNELPEKDKIPFITALLDRQFQGVKPDKLKGMAKFAYISQVNSIDSQVKGYEDKTKTKLTPCQGGAVGVNEKDFTPSLQVQEEVQEEVQGEEKVKGSPKAQVPIETIYINSKISKGFISEDFRNLEYFNLWIVWLDHKKEIKSLYKTEKGEWVAYQKLFQLSENNISNAKTIVLSSIENGWKGLFKMEEQKQLSGYKSKTDF